MSECQHGRALRAARAEMDRIQELRNEVIDLCFIATPIGYDEDDAVKTYAIPAGRLHRFIAAAQSAGIPAHLRALDWMPEVER